jgi:isopenicillin-N N-acyltransferase like protein
MKVFRVSGDGYAMGFQHGRQVLDLRRQIVRAMQNRLSLLERLPVYVRPVEQELAEAWEAVDMPMIDMLKGICAGLELEWRPFFRYSVASYLAGRADNPIQGQGCTTWAAGGALTGEHGPILAKNRDYRPDHRALQCLIKAHPRKGYVYSYLSSCGSPGVFSSGMNEKGLAVVDTHVHSSETGPGLARYSVMMKVLEEFSQVGEALEYLSSLRHMGDGTLTLADAQGSSAVFEAGHQQQAVILPKISYVVATNHFTSESLKQKWLDPSPIGIRGNTQKRYATVEGALRAAEESIDLDWARKLMASHLSPMEAICRHPEYEPVSVTISTVFYTPKSRQMRVAFGLPCRTCFYTLRVGARGHPD